MTTNPIGFSANPISYLWGEVTACQALGEAVYDQVLYNRYPVGMVKEAKCDKFGSCICPSIV